MEKWLIIYTSVTGNTERVAQAMTEAVAAAGGMVEVYPLKEAPADLSPYTVIAAGYWLRSGGPSDEMAAFLPQIEDKEVILFETHGSLPKSEHAVTAFARAAYLLGKGCRILGTFACQGRINPALLEKRRQSASDDPHKPTAASEARWAQAESHPDDADLQAAAALAVQLYEKRKGKAGA